MTVAQNDMALGDLASHINLSDEGLATVEKHSALAIRGFADLEVAEPNDIIFVATRKYALQASKTKAKVIVYSSQLAEELDHEKLGDKILLEVPDAKLSLAQVSKIFGEEFWGEPGVHTTANVDPSVRLGKNALIGPNVCIGAGTVLGDNVVVQANTVIGRNVVIGSNVVLFPNVTVYDTCEIGNDCRIHSGVVLGADGFGYAQEMSQVGVEHRKLFHVGRLRIGNNVEIGSCSSIDRGTIGDTVIGDGTKIDNQVQIGHNCKIGKSVLICGNTGLSGSVVVEDFVTIAGMCGVGDQAKIEAGTIVTGFTGVTGRATKGIYKGYPARDLRDFNKIQAALSFLPDLVKEFRLRKRKEKKNSSSE